MKVQNKSMLHCNSFVEMGHIIQQTVNQQMDEIVNRIKQRQCALNC
jgi:L-asparaginase II